jgi:membrane protease YdiL (CAAX protease family)
MKNKKPYGLYLLVVFLVSYLWQFVIFLTGGVESPLFPFVMFFPALVAIVFRVRSKEGFRQIGWGLRKVGYLLPALTVPLLVTWSVIALLGTPGWGALNGKYFIFHDGLVDIPTVPLVLGNHTQSIAFFVLNLTLSLGVVSLPGCIFTLGEELGWRGHLQEKVLREFGVARGLVFLGTVWGYWHAPLILMGYNFPNMPVIGALLLMPFSTVFMGIFLGWLYLRSWSIWVPTFAHATMNAATGILFGGVTMVQDEVYRQLAFIGAYGLVAVLCLISLRRNPPTLWQESATSAEQNLTVLRPGVEVPV